MFAKKQRPVNILHCIVTVHGACGCLLCAAGVLAHVVNLSHGKDLVACSLLLLLGLSNVEGNAFLSWQCMTGLLKSVFT